MERYYVYELINHMGTVEYIGVTNSPEERMISHTKIKPTLNGFRFNGKFYGRQDLLMNIVSVSEDKKSALELEGRLKLENGFEWTERNWTKTANGKKTAKNLINLDSHINKQSYICPSCGKEGKGRVMFRHHFDKCKNKLK